MQRTLASSSLRRRAIQAPNGLFPAVTQCAIPTCPCIVPLTYLIILQSVSSKTVAPTNPRYSQEATTQTDGVSEIVGSTVWWPTWCKPPATVCPFASCARAKQRTPSGREEKAIGVRLIDRDADEMMDRQQKRQMQFLCHMKLAEGPCGIAGAMAFFALNRARIRRVRVEDSAKTPRF